MAEFCFQGWLYFIPFFPDFIDESKSVQNTEERSALGIVREAELYGGVLSSSITREKVTITAEFLKGDE